MHILELLDIKIYGKMPTTILPFHMSLHLSGLDVASNLQLFQRLQSEVQNIF